MIPALAVEMKARMAARLMAMAPPFPKKMRAPSVMGMRELLSVSAGTVPEVTKTMRT